MRIRNVILLAALAVTALQPGRAQRPLDHAQVVGMPPHIAASAADLQPQAMVLGICRGHAWCAYPVADLALQGIVNDQLGESPVVLIYDAASLMTQAYDAGIGGRTLHFRSIGVRDGTPVLRDEETGTYWSQITGRALEGPLEGQSLVPIPVYTITWARWRELQPGTLVLKVGESIEGGPAASHLPPPATEVAASRRLDRRLSADALVLGVAGVSDSNAFSLDALAKSSGVINDHLDRRMTVVFYDAAGRAAAAYRPSARGRALVYRAEVRQGGRVFVDQQSGSIWTLEGRAVAGPLAGAQLQPESFTLSRWRAWSAAHARTRLYDPRHWR